MFSNVFFENRAVYDIMSKNVVELERPQMAKLRRVACWISKATRTQAHAGALAPTFTTTHARKQSTQSQTHTHTHTHTQ